MEEGKLTQRQKSGERKKRLQRGFFLWDEDFGRGSLYCLHLQEKWERGLLKVIVLLWAGKFQTQMSIPGPASGLCSVEGYFVGGEHGKIVFWKTYLSLWKQLRMLHLGTSPVKYFWSTWLLKCPVTLSEVRQRKTNILYRLYGESKKKNDTNELIYKTETDSQT